MNTSILQQQIEQLRKLLPVIEEKAKMGLIHFDSHVKARDLIRWHESGRTMSEKQVLFVGRLLQRANRKHKKIDLSVTGGSGQASTPVDVDKIVQQVLDKSHGAMAKVTADSVIPAVMKLVMDEVEKLKVPRKVEIVVKDAETGKVKKVKGPLHRNFDKLIKVATSRNAVNGYVDGIFLKGEASSGKTTAARQLAETLGLKWYFNGAISFAHEMLGFIDGNGKYHRTPFRDAYEYGGVYTFDEVDRSDPVALLGVNPHLANGIATFPDGQVKRHKNCIIICTANTWGLGTDAKYSGATKLDAAFLSRFPTKLNWDIDPELEEAIVENKEWLAKVRAARQRAADVGLEVMIDVRISLAGDAHIANGFSLEEAADMTYRANLKKDQIEQIEG